MVMNKSEAGKLGYLKSKPMQEYLYNKRIEEYNKNPTLCICCSKPLNYKLKRNKFCNKSCSTTYNNIKKGKKEYQCLNCNTKTTNKKYCNHTCEAKYKWEQKKQFIEDTNKFGDTDSKARRNCRRYLIEKYGHKCQICGITHWLNKPIVLISDHIDGNSNNNSIDNMRIICSNCDSTLDTYKSKNKGNGRINRKSINS